MVSVFNKCQFGPQFVTLLQIWEHDQYSHRMQQNNKLYSFEQNRQLFFRLNVGICALRHFFGDLFWYYYKLMQLKLKISSNELKLAEILITSYVLLFWSTICDTLQMKEHKVSLHFSNCSLRRILLVIFLFVYVI